MKDDWPICLKCGKVYNPNAGRKSAFWCPECDKKRQCAREAKEDDRS